MDFLLAYNLWPIAKRISWEENEELQLTFMGEELDAILSGMKTDSAPGPHGLPLAFYKRFWGILRKPVLDIINDFALGRVDISRLNFGVLTLIPKIKARTISSSLDRTLLLMLI
jgi:hypothetical protein